MKTVAIIFGGRSTEHDISVVTAIASIIKPLKNLKEYQIEPVYIAKDGAWYWDKKLGEIELFSGGQIEEFLRSTKPVSVQFDPNGGLSLVKTTGLTGRKVIKKIDVVFPAMHGTNGEDGALMGLLQMASIPFVGCNMESSVLSMNKLLTKQICLANSIPTSKFIGFKQSEFLDNPAQIIEQISKLKFPVFVKPVHLGSSIGITRVTELEHLNNALEVAFHYDDAVIVEEEVRNLIELTLPIMGNNKPAPALLEKPLTKPGDFFDFDTKYLQGGKKGAKTGKQGAQGYSQLPAQIPKQLYEKAEKLALKVYDVIGCQGTARIDLLVDEKSSEVYFNEINPLPGSLYSHNWRAAGVSQVDLVAKLINLAEDAHAKKKHFTTSFSTSYLKQF